MDDPGLRYIGRFNAAGLVAALVASLAVALGAGRQHDGAKATELAPEASPAPIPESSFGASASGAALNPRQGAQIVAADAVELQSMGNGRQGLIDASGHLVPAGRDGLLYRRIVSASLVADAVLLELCQPQRILAFSQYASRAYRAHRYAAKPQVGGSSDLEAVMALAPDLLLVTDITSSAHVARLREAGVRVFSVGSMRGLKTLIPTIERIGLLVGRAGRAHRLARLLRHRLAAMSASSVPPQRLTALYLGIIGGSVTGGTRGTSYHDVLNYAGLHDIAQDEYSGWPSFTTEQLLRLDPQVIVTSWGMGRMLCRRPGLRQLRACQSQRGGKGLVVELEPALIADPGLGIVDAAAAVHAQVYGFEAGPGRLGGLDEGNLLLHEP